MKNYSEEQLFKLVTSEVLKKIKSKKLQIHLINVNCLILEENILSNLTGEATTSLNPDIFFIGELSFSLIGRLVHCCPANLIEESLLRHLMDGKRVIVDEEGIEKNWNKEQLPYAMKQQLKENFSNLKKFNIEIKSTERNIKEKSTDKRVKKKILYHEAKVKQLNLASGSKFKVASNSLFTALARDYLHKNDIQIVVEAREER